MSNPSRPTYPGVPSMDVSQFQTIFAKWASAFEALKIDEATQDRLAQYLVALWARNMELNLVSRKLTAEALVTDHLLDSLIGLPHIPAVNRIADLGTGGGFPGVALAICRPKTKFLLFEKSPLKLLFLRSLLELVPNLEKGGELGLEEELSDVDLIVARGFKSIRETLKLTQAYHHRGGTYLIYKARKARILDEIAEVPNLKASLIQLKPYGDAEERHLVKIV